MTLAELFDFGSYQPSFTYELVKWSGNRLGSGSTIQPVIDGNGVLTGFQVILEEDFSSSQTYEDF